MLKSNDKPTSINITGTNWIYFQYNKTEKATGFSLNLQMQTKQVFDFYANAFTAESGARQNTLSKFDY